MNDAWTRIFHAWQHVYKQYESSPYGTQAYKDLGAAIDILWEAQKAISTV